MEAVLDNCDRRGLQAVQDGHTILWGIGPQVRRHGEQGWVPVAVGESGHGLLHTHHNPHVTSLPQRRMLVQDEGSQRVAGAAQRAKLHVCAKLGGGGGRYLGTRDWHRGSKTVELWVRTNFYALLIRPT